MILCSVLLNTIVGIIAILYGVVAFIGYYFKIERIKNLYYTAWLKSTSTRFKVVVFYFVCSALLILVGLILLFGQVDIQFPFAP